MSVLKVCYIREKEDTCDFIKRIIVRIKRLFNIIDIVKNNGKLIYYLPIFNGTKLTKYRINKLSMRIVNKLENEGIKNIALSKYLETIPLLKSKLYCKNVNILDGRLLFKCLSYELIEYILNIKNKKIQERRYNFIS